MTRRRLQGRLSRRRLAGACDALCTSIELKISSSSSVQALEEDLKRLKARHDETTKVTLRDVQKELDDLTVFKDSIWDKMSGTVLSLSDIPDFLTVCH